MWRRAPETLCVSCYAYPHRKTWHGVRPKQSGQADSAGRPQMNKSTDNQRISWMMNSSDAASRSQPDSAYATVRLAVTLGLMTIGASGMYVVAVVLPAVQAEFGVARADASLPYTMMMIGFGLGGMLMGRLADRF